MFLVGVGRLGGDQKIDRDHFGALVQQLEEGVLAVGARLAEDDRAGGARRGRAVARHALAVRLHVELLEIGRKTAEALVVGNDGLGGKAPDIAVPDADQAHQDGNIVRQRRVAEMLVHIVPAAQEFLEMARGR